MADDLIASIYRKACPCCAHELAQYADHCSACGYTDPTSNETEEAQERLYVEYVEARLRQAKEALEKIQRAPVQSSHSVTLAQAKEDVVTLWRELMSLRAQEQSAAPRVAQGDKACPACRHTMPQDIGHCACGYVFGGALSPGGAEPDGDRNRGRGSGETFGRHALLGDPRAMSLEKQGKN